METLNSDVLNIILSFLPILNNTLRTILVDIRKNKVRRDLEEIYKKRWNGIFAESYIDCLSNDIGRWMNNDIALMNKVSLRYKKFIRNTFNVNESDISHTVLIYLERIYSSKELITVYLNYLNEDEINEVKRFCINLDNNIFLPNWIHFC